MSEYPFIASNGWKVLAVPDAFGMPGYQNAHSGNNGAVTSMTVGDGALAVPNSTTSSMTSTALTMSTTSSTVSTSTSTIASNSKSASASAEGQPPPAALAANASSKISGATWGPSLSMKMTIAVVEFLW